MPPRAASPRAGNARLVRGVARYTGRALVLALASLFATALPCVPREAAAQRPRTPAEREARHVQRTFESYRRFQLPRVMPRDGSCDVTIGRFCYWDNNDDTPLPAEHESVTRARERLRASLDSLAALDSTSDYIAGQSVRYALEAHDADAAIAFLDDCDATPWWCLALRGLTWHRVGSESRSTAAFDSALAVMPDAYRCEWMDVEKWIPSGTHLWDDDHDDCAGHEEAARRVLWLAAPLLTWQPEATRNELLARRTLLRLLRGTSTPHRIGWGSDLVEVSLRFGWPDSWAREEEAIGSIMMPSGIRVVGEEPKPSFSFVPNRHALESPLEAAPDDWQLDGDRKPPMRYAPGWVTTIDTLPVQLARFLRAGGDSMLVVAVFDARTMLTADSIVASGSPPDSNGTDAHAATGAQDGAPPAGMLGEAPSTPDSAATPRAAALLAVSAESTLAAGEAERDTSGAIVLASTRRPVLAAVEVMDSALSRAARWRGSVQPLDSTALLSDILVGLAAGGAPPPILLDSATPRAIAPLVVSAGDTIALYWESYARATKEHPARVRLRLVPLSSGFFGRVVHALGLKHREPPVSLAWDDPGSPDSQPGRALRVAIPDVPDGSYRIELVIEAGGRQGSAARKIVVR
ncbi:MAG TPA: hypothetical protein VFR95_05815 [Gemmatimonadaceae bacterium]|nr:hypothetical protein [Gemmatimonadaceae bacterium]